MTKLTIIAPERQPHKRFTPVCAVAHDSAPEAGCGRAVLFGPKVIIAEYAITVAAGLLVAVLSLRAGLQVTHARWQIVLGLYLWFIALTSALLTAHAIAMARRGNCRDEIADELELEHTTTAILRKYRKQSLWLRVPLVAPFGSDARV